MKLTDSSSLMNTFKLMSLAKLNSKCSFSLNIQFLMKNHKQPDDSEQFTKMCCDNLKFKSSKIIFQLNTYSNNILRFYNHKMELTNLNANLTMVMMSLIAQIHLIYLKICNWKCNAKRRTSFELLQQDEIKIHIRKSTISVLFFYQRIFVAYSETCADVRAVFSNITSSIVQLIYLSPVYSFHIYRWYDWLTENDCVLCATCVQSKYNVRTSQLLVRMKLCRTFNDGSEFRLISVVYHQNATAVKFVQDEYATWKWIHQFVRCSTQRNDWKSLYQFSLKQIEYVKFQLGQAIGILIAWLHHIATQYHLIHST